MDYKHCCIIDKEKNYKEFVLVVNGEIQGYILQNGEQLVEAPFPGNYVQPKWESNTWRETATEDEITAAKAAMPEIYA